MPGTHMEVHVGAKSFGHLLGFLSGKGLAVNFDASAYCLYFLIAGISPCVSGSITIVGPESTPPTFTENNKPELLLFQPLPHRLPCMSCGQTVKTPWYAIIRGLEVGVRHTWWAWNQAIALLTYIAYQGECSWCCLWCEWKGLTKCIGSTLRDRGGGTESVSVCCWKPRSPSHTARIKLLMYW